MGLFLKSEKPIIILAVIFTIAIVVFNVFDLTTDKSKQYSYSSVEAQNYEATVVNINTADIEELTTLPNIGENTAENIIEYRNEHNSFETVEEIKNVSGIGEQDYLTLIPFITVE